MHATSPLRTAVARALSGPRTLRRLGLAGALLLGASAPLHAAPVASLLEATGTGSPTSIENYRAFLPKLYATANARPLETVWNPTRKTLKDLNATLDGAGAGRFVAQSTAGSRTTLACPGGGTVVASRDGAPATAPLLAVFKRCDVDGQRLDGPVSWTPGRSELAIFGTAIGVTQTRAFTHTDAGGLTTVINGHRWETRPTEGGRSLAWNGDWGLKSGAKTLTVKAMKLAADGTAGNYRYQSDFEMIGTATNGNRVPVATYEPFSNDYGPNFVHGYMQVLVLGGPAFAQGKIAISPSTESPDAFNLNIATFRAPGDSDYVDVGLPQTFGGGPLKLGAR